MNIIYNHWNNFKKNIWTPNNIYVKDPKQDIHYIRWTHYTPIMPRKWNVHKCLILHTHVEHLSFGCHGTRITHWRRKRATHPKSVLDEEKFSGHVSIHLLKWREV